MGSFEREIIPFLAVHKLLSVLWLGLHPTTFPHFHVSMPFDSESSFFVGSQGNPSASPQSFQACPFCWRHHSLGFQSFQLDLTWKSPSWGLFFHGTRKHCAKAAKEEKQLISLPSHITYEAQKGLAREGIHMWVVTESYLIGQKSHLTESISYQVLEIQATAQLLWGHEPSRQSLLLPCC